MERLYLPNEVRSTNENRRIVGGPSEYLRILSKAMSEDQLITHFFRLCAHKFLAGAVSAHPFIRREYIKESNFGQGWDGNDKHVFKLIFCDTCKQLSILTPRY